MLMLFTLFQSLLLLMVFVQDFRHREISVWILPALALLLFAEKSVEVGWKMTALITFLNVALIAIQVLFITVYFSIKEQRLCQVMDRFIGWGDVGFMWALAPMLTPLPFIFFELTSFTVALLVGLLLLWKGDGVRGIPLAGVMAGCVMMFNVFGSEFLFIF